MNTLYTNRDPKVSIVIPVYNGSNYVRGAIESALKQTYSNVEIVVINDGSNDDGATEEICKSFEDKIVYVKQENQGVAGAMNTAFEYLTGDLFCWLSHDDEHLPDKTQNQVDFLRSLGRDNLMAFGNYYLINDQGEVWHESQMNRELLSRTPSIALLRGMINGCTLMIPTHLIRKHLPFRTDLRFTQDYDMWDRIRADGEFVFMPETVVRYRVHPGQDTNNPMANVEGDRLWEWMISRRSDSEKVILNGSRKKYFTELEKFLDETPYAKAAEFAKEQAKIAEENILVSVIIPFYNEPDLTCRAIESALNQTHSHVEIIAVNDGSNLDISAVRELAALHSNVKLIDIENGGVGNARNIGLQNATGEYIAFLDSDDCFLPQKIAFQLTEMIDTGHLFSHTSYSVEYPEGRLGRGTINSGTQNGDLYPDLIRSCAIATPTVMIHRILVAKGFAFPTRSNLGEDIQAWLWVAARHMILGIEKPLSVITWRDDSAALNIEKAIKGVASIIEDMSAHPIHGRYPEKIACLADYKNLLIGLKETARSHPDGASPKKLIYLDAIRLAFSDNSKIHPDTGTCFAIEVGTKIGGTPEDAYDFIIRSE